ncbi:MAG: hypothetical protein VX841_02505 [Pseudomonadota bacterium]|jgi:hypothetical protein|nr:hypothetical protein [Pseudomonadota bacterium]
MTNENLEKLKQDESYLKISQKYPHIAKKLLIFWGSEFCEPYLDSLFTETRSGTRRGFPPDDMLALLNIRLLHEEQYEFERKQDVWTYPH